MSTLNSHSGSTILYHFSILTTLAEISTGINWASSMIKPLKSTRRLPNKIPVKRGGRVRKNIADHRRNYEQNIGKSTRPMVHTVLICYVKHIIMNFKKIGLSLCRKIRFLMSDLSFNWFTKRFTLVANWICNIYLFVGFFYRILKPSYLTI